MFYKQYKIGEVDLRLLEFKIEHLHVEIAFVQSDACLGRILKTNLGLPQTLNDITTKQEE